MDITSKLTCDNLNNRVIKQTSTFIDKKKFVFSEITTNDIIIYKLDVYKGRAYIANDNTKSSHYEYLYSQIPKKHALITQILKEHHQKIKWC